MNNAGSGYFRRLGIFLCLVFVGLLWSGAIALRADTHYVSLAGTNNTTDGYTNWPGAATQIQWAVDKASASDTVLVSNGTYNLTNQISITANITVQSLYGTNNAALLTIVNGNYPAYTNRCFYMANGVLDGFTISNGMACATNGGGIYINANGKVCNCLIYGNYCSNGVVSGGGGGIYIIGAGTVSNCSIVGNNVCSGDTAAWNKYGGGVYTMNSGGLIVDSRISGNIAYIGGGAYQDNGGVFSNCIISGNQARYRAGGTYMIIGARVWNSVISNNVALSSDVGGVKIVGAMVANSIIIGNVASNNVGGVSLEETGINGGILSNCHVVANVASNQCGGILLMGAIGANMVINSVITRNVSKGQGAGIRLSADGGYIAPGVVRNCLIYNNTNSSSYGGGVVLSSLSTNYPYGLINCTIAGNEAGTYGGGIYASGVSNYIVNCIIYSNATTGDSYDEIYNNTAANTNNYWYTCVRPTPGVANTTLAPNQGNITNDPSFIDFTVGNYRLNANSPCINRGTNQAWMTNSYDFDGRTRIRYGIVDLGPYERIYSGTMYIFH